MSKTKSQVSTDDETNNTNCGKKIVKMMCVEKSPSKENKKKRKRENSEASNCSDNKINASQSTTPTPSSKKQKSINNEKKIKSEEFCRSDSNSPERTPKKKKSHEKNRDLNDDGNKSICSTVSMKATICREKQKTSAEDDTLKNNSKNKIKQANIKTEEFSRSESSSPEPPQIKMKTTTSKEIKKRKTSESSEDRNDVKLKNNNSKKIINRTEKVKSGEFCRSTSRSPERLTKKNNSLVNSNDESSDENMSSKKENKEEKTDDYSISEKNKRCKNIVEISITKRRCSTDSDESDTNKNNNFSTNEKDQFNNKTIANDLYKNIIDPDTTDDENQSKYDDDMNSNKSLAKKPIFQSQRPVRNSVDNFVANKKNIQLCKDKTNKNSALSLNSDEEIWILQCPKKINIQSFLGKKIDLSKTTKLKTDNIECVSEPFSRQQNLTLFSNDSEKTAIEFKPAGKLIVRETIQCSKTNLDNYEQDNENFPFPENLKLRHPLFGADYKKNVNLTDELKYKLQKAGIRKINDRAINVNINIKAEIMAQSDNDNDSSDEDNFLTKKRRSSSEKIEENNDENNDGKNVSPKKSSKNKDKSLKSKIKSKNSETKKDKSKKSDISKDLEWLKKI